MRPLAAAVIRLERALHFFVNPLEKKAVSIVSEMIAVNRQRAKPLARGRYSVLKLLHSFFGG